MTDTPRPKNVTRNWLSACLAAGGAILWLATIYIDDKTFPDRYEQLDLATAAVFVAVGVVGGWRSLLFAAAAGVAAALLDHLIWALPSDLPHGLESSCDPGCLTLEAAVVIDGTFAFLLALVGRLVRVAGSLLRRRRDS